MLDRDVAAEVRKLTSDGELLAAVDLARDEAPQATTLADRHAIQIEEVVALARMASLEEAQEKFREYGLAEALDSRARSLTARFTKDLGFEAEGEERVSLLCESRDIYLDIARRHDADGEEPDRTQFEYNGINALTLSSIIGDMTPVRAIAETLSATTPSRSYWSWATRAELLLASGAGDAEIIDALETAIGIDPDNIGGRATTYRQIARIDPRHPALAILKPGPVVHYSGHMIAPVGAETGRILARNEGELTRRIEAELDRLNPSAIYGSLASGVDLIAVEWALKRELDARVFLPFGREHFIETSIAPAGHEWTMRARRCLRDPKAKVATLTDDAPITGDDEAYRAVSRVAMGGAMLRAAHIGADAVQLLAWDGEETGGVAGASADRAMWLATGNPMVEIDVADLGSNARVATSAPAVETNRHARSIVFGDVKNFSKLKEPQLPVFVERVMGAVEASLGAAEARYGDGAILFRNTWGDGVFAVFEAAAPAAFFALDLQGRMAGLQTGKEEGEPSLPPELAIRLGLHHGVVYRLREPVTGAQNYFGEAIARAARIEPVTEAGRIFVSEEFAAELALDPESPAEAEYVGEKDTAKKYGRFRLYRIKPR
ncbi:MAG: adenylate/guanylate cyclase domain-containing protein [Pseudomonadota bacterium]